MTHLLNITRGTEVREGRKLDKTWAVGLLKETFVVNGVQRRDESLSITDKEGLSSGLRR